MISIRCPKCLRQISFIRVKSGEGVCQNCNTVTPKVEIERQKKEQSEK